jgi:hypothetical protein
LSADAKHRQFCAGRIAGALTFVSFLARVLRPAHESTKAAQRRPRRRNCPGPNAGRGYGSFRYTALTEALCRERSAPCPFDFVARHRERDLILAVARQALDHAEQEGGDLFFRGHLTEN